MVIVKLGTQQMETWTIAGVLVGAAGLIWVILHFAYRNKIERLQDQIGGLNQELDERGAEVTSLRSQKSTLESEVEVLKAETARMQERFDLREKEQVETEKGLNEHIQTLIRGEVGTSKIIEWEGLFQIKLTSYIPQAVSFSRDWIGVSPGPLEKYKVQYESTIRPEDGPLTFDLRPTEGGGIMKWVKEQGGDIAKKHKIWIYQLENHFQVVVKSLMEEELEGDISIRSSSIPVSTDRLTSNFRIGPGSDPVVITRAGY